MTLQCTYITRPSTFFVDFKISAFLSVLYTHQRKHLTGAFGVVFLKNPLVHEEWVGTGEMWQRIFFCWFFPFPYYACFRSKYSWISALDALPGLYKPKTAQSAVLRNFFRRKRAEKFVKKSVTNEVVWQGWGLHKKCDKGFHVWQWWGPWKCLIRVT